MGARDLRFPHFDSLRAIAALSVFGLHTTYLLGLFSTSSLGHWFKELSIGVPIFFVISGFLLYRPFARARFDDEPRPRVRAYLARRGARIVPAYWVMLLGAAAVLGLSNVLSAEGAYKYGLFLQIYDPALVSLPYGIGHTWTLCVEIAFYLFLPLWAIAIRAAASRVRTGFMRFELGALALLLVGSIAWKALTIRLLDKGDDAFWPLLLAMPAYLDLFAIGMGLAVVSVALAGREQQPAAVRLLDRAPWIAWLGAAGVFVVLGLDHRSLGPGLASQAVVHQQLQGLVALGVVLPAIFGEPGRGLVRRLLAHRALLWVGLISYGLYLWHLPVLTQLHDWGVADEVGGTAYGLIGLVVSLSLAAASWYLLERHVIDYVRRRTRSKRAPEVPEPTTLASGPAG